MVGGAVAEGAKTDVQAQTDATQMNQVDGFFQASRDQVLASKLLDKTVYSGTGEDAEEIGQVADVVITQDGKAQALVIGVGGFLGIGTKDVAIDYSRVEWVKAQPTGADDQAGQNDWTEDNQRLVVNATKEELENAPEFDRALVTDQQMTSADTGTDQPATGTGTDQQMTSAETDAEQPATGTGTDQQMTSAETDAEQPATGTGTDQQMTSAETDAEQPMTGTESEQQMTTDTTADQEDPAALDQTAQTETDPAAPAQPAREGMQMVDAMTLSAEELIGTNIYGQGDEDLGEVGDVIVTAEDEVRAYIIDVGGFLGIGEKNR
ncbi:PRC-barrel domain-containing protein [Roseibium salinum]|nr:PRC-barrel domain-containing protein [Roseibium salinum]